MIVKDISGQASAELILLMAGVIAIVLLAISIYQEYLLDFTTEINNTEVNNLLEEIDDLKKIL